MAKQAWHHGNSLLSQKSVEKVLKDGSVSPFIRKKLHFVQQLLEYAHLEGLNSVGAYQAIVLTDESSVSYLVQAALPDQLKFYTWWYPIVGTVPYKGFFDKKERDQLAYDLGNLGYDVHLGEAAAFSSLGWYEDPLFSSMLHRSDAHLADLIFHELTHRTYWLSGQVEFNEQLASFVGYHLTIQFLQEKKMVNQKERYISWHVDRRLYKSWLQELRNELERLYNSRHVLKDGSLGRRKHLVFNDYINTKKPKFKKFDFIKSKKRWNNATVLAASLYSPPLKRFQQFYRCSKAKDIGGFLRFLEDNLDSAASPMDQLNTLCPR